MKNCARINNYSLVIITLTAVIIAVLISRPLELRHMAPLSGSINHATVRVLGFYWLIKPNFNFYFVLLPFSIFL